MIEATFAVDGQDVAAFAVRVAESSRAYQRSRNATSLTCAVVIVSLGIGLVGQLERRDAITILPIVFLLGGIAGVSVYLSYPRYVVREVRRAYERSRAPTLLGRQRLVIDSGGLRITSDHAVTEYKWSGITQLCETKDHIFAFVGPFRAVVIPKAGVQGTEPGHSH